MVDALVARLDRSSLQVGTPVRSIDKDSASWVVETDAARHGFDALILATPAWSAAALLASVDAGLASELAAIPYSSSITINLVYRESQLGSLPEGFGFLVPSVEGRRMLACTFVHRKFLGRTPPGTAVIRAFLGGVNNEALLDAPDDVLASIARRELSEILGSKVFPAAAQPEYVQVSRWRRAMAQYAVGHRDRVQRINARVAALSTLRLAGNAYDGVGIPDCIRLGRQAARELAAASSPALAGTLASRD
jgi:oxygen-dependent protoporphyrinogen oxidase